VRDPPSPRKDERTHADVRVSTRCTKQNNTAGKFHPHRRSVMSDRGAAGNGAIPNVEPRIAFLTASYLSSADRVSYLRNKEPVLNCSYEEPAFTLHELHTAICSLRSQLSSYHHNDRYALFRFGPTFRVCLLTRHWRTNCTADAGVDVPPTDSSVGPANRRLSFPRRARRQICERLQFSFLLCSSSAWRAAATLPVRRHPRCPRLVRRRLRRIYRHQQPPDPRLPR
jgi:hypothetical protein